MLTDMDIKKVMQQAQDLQNKMQKAQDALETIDITGTAGAGDYIVTVIITGKGVTKKVHIADKLINVEDKAMLEDLIIAAFNNAKSKLDDAIKVMMSKFNIPPELLGN